MTKKLRLLLIVCGIVCGVGILLSIVGYALGGQKGFAALDERIPFVNLGSWGGPVQTETQTLNAFSSIDFDGDLGEINFIQGDKYQIEIAYKSEKHKPRFAVSGGTLRITAKKEAHFGISLGDWNETETVINVYYPKNAVFNDVKIVCDLGDINIKDLSAKRLNVNADMGEIDIESVKADMLVAELDLGDLEARNIVTKGMELNLDGGSADINGAISGKTKATMNLGDCNITTSLPKEQYAVKTSLDLGECEVDGENINGEYNLDNPSAKNQIDVNCDLGDINIDFNRI